MTTRHAKPHRNPARLRRLTISVLVATFAITATQLAIPAQANALPGTPYSPTRYAFCWASFNPWMWFVSGATMQGFRACLR